uniref:(California timema) hypothetical protein n=1 Tax=Timema californicum TaxID=61474 RepID=A0A7R9JAK3_TIMCA|nr:unnamed protein product [Timema californicum]
MIIPADSLEELVHQLAEQMGWNPSQEVEKSSRTSTGLSTFPRSFSEWGEVLIETYKHIESWEDLTFSPDFSSEDKTVLARIALESGLLCRRVKTSNFLLLVVSKQFFLSKVIKSLITFPELNNKYELLPPEIIPQLEMKYELDKAMNSPEDEHQTLCDPAKTKQMKDPLNCRVIESLSKTCDEKPVASSSNLVGVDKKHSLLRNKLRTNLSSKGTLSNRPSFLKDPQLAKVLPNGDYGQMVLLDSCDLGAVIEDVIRSLSESCIDFEFVHERPKKRKEREFGLKINTCKILIGGKTVTIGQHKKMRGAAVIAANKLMTKLKLQHFSVKGPRPRFLPVPFISDEKAFVIYAEKLLQEYSREETSSALVLKTDLRAKKEKILGRIAKRLDLKMFRSQPNIHSIVITKLTNFWTLVKLLASGDQNANYKLIAPPSEQVHSIWQNTPFLYTNKKLAFTKRVARTLSIESRETALVRYYVTANTQFKCFCVHLIQMSDASQVDVIRAGGIQHGLANELGLIGLIHPLRLQGLEEMKIGTSPWETNAREHADTMTKNIDIMYQAELRASVFLALEEQETSQTQCSLHSKSLTQFLSTRDGLLITSLVREFLEFFKLDFTLSVFDPETSHGKEYSYGGRNKLISDLDLKINKDTYDKEPLLAQILKLSRTRPNNLTSKETKRDLDNSIEMMKLDETRILDSGTSIGPGEKNVLPTEAQLKSNKDSMPSENRTELGHLQHSALLSNEENFSKSSCQSQVTPRDSLIERLDVPRQSDGLKLLKNTSNRVGGHGDAPRKNPLEGTSLSSLSNLPPLLGSEGKQPFSANPPKDPDMGRDKAIIDLDSGDNYEEDFNSSGSGHPKSVLATDSEIEEEIGSGIDDLLSLNSGVEDMTADKTMSSISGAADYIEDIH